MARPLDIERRAQVVTQLALAAYALDGPILTENMISHVHGARRKVVRDVLAYFVSARAAEVVSGPSVRGATRYQLSKYAAFLLPREIDGRRLGVHCEQIREMIECEEFTMMLAHGPGLGWTTLHPTDAVWRQGVFAIGQPEGWRTYGDVGLAGDVASGLITRYFDELKAGRDGTGIFPERTLSPEEISREAELQEEILSEDWDRFDDTEDGEEGSAPDGET